MPQETANPAATPGPSAVDANPKHAVQAVTNGMKWGVVAGTVVIPLIGIVMGVTYMRDPGTDKRRIGKLWLTVGIVAGIVWILYYCSATSSYNY
jgi:hypothetical protein